MIIPHAHWSDDTENVLKKIRLNSLLRSKYHKMSYFNMNKLLKYFRIPVIVLSGLSSVFNIALQHYIAVDTASLICCFISLTVGIIGSIEMFLQIQKRMEIDLHNSKSFGFLATDISKLLNLSREHRTVDGLIYLEEKMNEYNSLVDLSIVTDVQLDEKILELDLIDNLTPEEQLRILSNDNLQSIFRRYNLRFLRNRAGAEEKGPNGGGGRLKRNGSISTQLSAMMSMRGTPPPTQNSPRNRTASNPPTPTIATDPAAEFYNIYNNRPAHRRSGSRPPSKNSYYTNQMATQLAQQMVVTHESDLPVPNDTTKMEHIIVDIEAPIPSMDTPPPPVRLPPIQIPPPVLKKGGQSTTTYDIEDDASNSVKSSISKEEYKL